MALEARFREVGTGPPLRCDDRRLRVVRGFRGRHDPPPNLDGPSPDADRGPEVVAVSDSRGAVYGRERLDVARVARAKRGHASVTGFGGPHESSCGAGLLAVGADVRVPAARGSVPTVSYFGWAQNARNTSPDEEPASGELERRMGKAYDDVVDQAREAGDSQRPAGCVPGARRVARATELRGP